MIYYTLLPKDEIKALRKEYHIRLFITLIFFISCIFLFGIFSLIPSYIYSFGLDNRDQKMVSNLKKDSTLRGAEQIEKELIDYNNKLKEIIANSKTSGNYYELIQDIISNSQDKVSINSFNISKGAGTSTPIEIIFQGKAPTREVLISFKEGLELENNFSKVELPLSDLVKNKDITFSIRLETRIKEEINKK